MNKLKVLIGTVPMSSQLEVQMKQVMNNSGLLKKIRTVIFLACVATMAQAQTEKGKWTFVPTAGDNLIISKPLDYEIGVTAGVGVDWQATGRVAMSSGVFYSLERYHTNSLLMNNRFTINTGRIEIPLLANVYVYKNLALKAGIQANFRLHSGAEDQEETLESAYSLPMTVYSKNTGDAMQAFYFSIPMGVSYEINCFVFDLRYIFGLQNLRLNYRSESNSYYNMQIVSEEEYTGNKKVNKLQLTVGYRL